MGLSFGNQNKTTNYNQNTNTVSNPWGITIPALTGLVNSAAGTSTAVTPGQNAAFSTLLNNAALGDPGYGAISGNAASQLGAGNQTGIVNQGLANEQQQLTPIANGSLTDISKNPQIQALLSTIQQDVGNKVNQEFAGAGRALSPDNSQALARGISQGEAAPLLNEYNTLLGNQLTAAQALGGATNAAAGTNAGLIGAQIGAQNAGINTDQAALNALNYGADQTLNVGQQQTQLPFQNLGMLASLIAPIAGLGGTQNSQQQGTSVTNGTSFGANLNILSDERAKTDKREVGALHDGTPIYSYRYKGDAATHVGPMAQDIEKSAPEAVQTRPDGLKEVNMRAATDKAAAIVRKRVQERRRKAA